MSAKQRRQQLIIRIITSGSVGSQPELQGLLKAHDVTATQATISRDLEEIGAVKIRVAGGATRYAIPEPHSSPPAPSDQLRRVLSEWVGEVSSSGNLVVLRTPPGCAHVVASALDRSGHASLLGTVAGDDTVLCVARESAGGGALASQLRSLAGLVAPTGRRPK